jgi:putative copper resistance protein D
MPDIVVASLRAISFVAVLQAAGIAMFLSLYGRSLVRSAVIIRSLGIGAAVTGSLFTLAQHLTQPARMTGSLSGIFDGSLQTILLNSDVGTTGAIRLFGLLMLVFGLRKTSRMGEAVSLIGATLVVVSFGLMGHTAAHDQRWALIVLLLVHLLIIAFWFGALMPLYVAARRETADTNARVIENFSAVAAWLVPIIFVAGVGMSVVLLEELSNLWTPYGIALLAKIAGFGLLMGLAALNKWRLGPAIAAGNTESLAIFRRSVVAEWCLIVGVLTVTAAMTLLFSPTHE